MNKKFAIGCSLLLLSLFVVAGYLAADFYRTIPDDIERRFVGRDSCIQCHQTEMAAFEGSDHDLAMDLATDESVLANFNDQTLTHDGLTSRMFRDGERFMVHTDGPDGQMRDYEIKYVFGVRPLQQYMVELDRPENAKPDEVGRVQVLRESWDTEKEQWFYLMPPDVDELIEADDPLHWTGITQNWNASCASCHSTDVHKNFRPAVAEYRTTFSEIDVSCEACHGPASYHVELANRKSPFWDRKHGYGLVNLKTTSNIPQVESCAPCHSRRTMMSESFRPGCNFDDYFATQTIVDPIYHVDGQVRDEDYVYGSFIQSKMFHKGIKCTDCHDPHSTRLKYTGNALCTSCHQNQHPAGKYDTPNHHHHEPGQPGSFCVDCHMPATTYMMLDSRRDHSFRVPRPDLSIQHGTPNACSSCHLDETKISNRTSEQPLRQYLDWIIAAEQGDEVIANELDRTNQAMQQAIEKWYVDPPETERTKYYEQLAAALASNDDTMNSNDQVTLFELAVDRNVPAIVRASATTQLVRELDDQAFEVAKEALLDPDPKVAAAALLRIDAEIGRIAEQNRYSEANWNSDESFDEIASLVAPMLSSPHRRVRNEAARVFATLPPTTRSRVATPRQRRDFEAALSEFEQSLLVENDRASTHMMLGSLHEMMGEIEKAKNDYRTAIGVEPNVSGPRTNLAAVINAEVDQLRNQMQLMRSGQSGGVQAGQLRQMLEQIQSKQLRIAQLRAEEHLLLEKDINRSAGLDDTHGLHYRFAMSAFLQRDLEKTEKHLKIAHEQQPENETYLLGLATYYVQVQNAEAAIQFTDQLLSLDPNHQGYQNLKTAAMRIPRVQSPPPKDQPEPAPNNDESGKENQ
ncbi:MAG: cytochrome c3 family protein [Planctomycetota bacterium]